MDNLDISVSTDDIGNAFYLYCCRMQVEFTDMKRYISEDEEEELFSDVYDVRTWNLTKPVLTFTLTTHGIPRKNQKISFISPVGNIGQIDSFTKKEDENVIC